jgi:hypothetical protein
MSVTADFTAIETGLFSKLSTASGTVLWGAGSAARVYADEAVAGAAIPYVRFFLVGGGDENLNPAGSFNVVYQIECWGTALSQTRQGATYINAALHHQTLTISGATNYWTVQRDLVRSVEDIDGKQYYRRGGTYQIRGG